MAAFLVPRRNVFEIPVQNLNSTGFHLHYRGWRDLHPDAPKDHWPIMDHLLAKGAHHDLTSACRRNDMDRVKEILADDPQAATHDADYSVWYSGYPLRSAAKGGHLDIVELLLENGADPNWPEHGLAPWGASVYDSTQNGHYDVVKFLLENGANPSQEVESSGCPLSAANDDRTKQLLRDHGAVYDAFGCCYYGHPVDWAVLCERNPFVACQSELVAMAAEKGFREIVDTFLKYEPDIWQRMPAIRGESEELTKWMLENGMNPSQTNWLDIHQLHRGDSPGLPVWLQQGVDINMVDGENQSTPLGWAARRGQIDYARALIENGADPNAAGAPWARPLAWATRRGFDELVDLLKKSGAIE